MSPYGYPTPNPDCIVCEGTGLVSCPECYRNADWGMYLIWSFEHNAWWGHAENGYVTAIIDAGSYSFQDALRIVSEANRYSQCVNEAMVPDIRLWDMNTVGK